MDGLSLSSKRGSRNLHRMSADDTENKTVWDSQLYEIQPDFPEKVTDHDELEALVEQLSLQLKISKRNSARRKNEDADLDCHRDKLLTEIHEKVSAVWDKIGVLDYSPKRKIDLHSELQYLREKNQELEREIAELKLEHECRLVTEVKETFKSILAAKTKTEQLSNEERMLLGANIPILQTEQSLAFKFNKAENPISNEVPIENNLPTKSSLEIPRINTVPGFAFETSNTVDYWKRFQINLTSALDAKNLELKSELLEAIAEVKRNQICLSKTVVSKMEGQALLQRLESDKQELKSELLQAFERTDQHFKEERRKFCNAIFKMTNINHSEATHASKEPVHIQANETTGYVEKKSLADVSLKHEITVLKSLLRSIQGQFAESGGVTDFNSKQAFSITNIENSTEKQNSMLSFLIDCISKYQSNTLKALDALNKKIQASDADVVELWKKSFSKRKTFIKSPKTLRSNSFPGHFKSPQKLLKKLDKWDEKVLEMSKNLANVVKDLKDCHMKWTEQIEEDFKARKKIIKDEKKYRNIKRASELKNAEELKEDVALELNLGKLKLEKESRRLNRESKRLNLETERLKSEWEKLTLIETLLSLQKNSKEVKQAWSRSDLCFVKRLELPVNSVLNAQQVQQKLISNIFTKIEHMSLTLKEQEKKIDIFLSGTVSEMVAMYAKESMLGESILTLLCNLKTEIGKENEKRNKKLDCFENSIKENHSPGKQQTKVDSLCSYVKELTEEVRKILMVTSVKMEEFGSVANTEVRSMDKIQDLNQLRGNLLNACWDNKLSKDVDKLSSDIAEIRESFRSVPVASKNNKFVLNACKLGKLELIGNSMNTNNMKDFMFNALAYLEKEQVKNIKKYVGEIVESSVATAGDRQIKTILSELKYLKRTAVKVEEFSEHLLTVQEKFKLGGKASSEQLELKVSNLSSKVEKLYDEKNNWKDIQPLKLECASELLKSIRETATIVRQIYESQSVYLKINNCDGWASEIKDLKIMFNSSICKILEQNSINSQFHNKAFEPALTTIKEGNIELLASVRDAIKSAFEEIIVLLEKKHLKIMLVEINESSETIHPVTQRANEEQGSSGQPIESLAPKIPLISKSQNHTTKEVQEKKLTLRYRSSKESSLQLGQITKIRTVEEIEKRIRSVQTLLESRNSYVLALEGRIQKIINDSETRTCSSISNIITRNLGTAVNAIRSGTSLLHSQIDQLKFEYRNQIEKTTFRLPRWVYFLWITASISGLLEIGLLLYGLICMFHKHSSNFFVS